MNATADDTIEIALQNDLGEIADLAARIDRFCEAREISPEIAYAVNLSLDELLTNTISYGYDDDEAHRIEVTLRLAGETLLVTIVDDSGAFDPTKTPEPDVAAPLEERAMGGLGLFLVHQMMDGFEYRRRAGRNVVTLTKRTAAGE